LNRSNIKRDYGSKGYHAEKLNNHKLINIEYLDNPITVGTLTIDGGELFHNYHNFALDIGIYTKNSMLEDFWLPRREGNKSTEITTLSGGENLGVLEDVIYFEKKLYKSLGVPVARLNPQEGFSLGRATEVTRDELKFARFIERLRNRFATLFDDALRIQLVTRGVCTLEEWEEFKEFIQFDFMKDNFFTELKEAEITSERLGLLGLIGPYTGVYYSEEWVRKNILRMNDDDIRKMKKQIEQEAAEKEFQFSDGEGGMGDMKNPVQAEVDAKVGQKIVDPLEKENKDLNNRFGKI
jgi:hypothetical protein